MACVHVAGHRQSRKTAFMSDGVTHIMPYPLLLPFLTVREILRGQSYAACSSCHENIH